MPKKTDTYIEIDKNYLKILQSEKTAKGLVVTRLLTEPVLGLSDEQIAKLLRDSAANSRIKLDSVTVIISRQKTMVRYMRLPAVDKAEIEKMVSFEIAKQTPYSSEEIVSDYEVLDSDGQGYSRVMLAITPKTEIARIDNILAQSGKRLKRIILSSKAVIGWLNTAAADMEKDKGICVIDIDSDNTEITVTVNHRLEFSRSISSGAADILKAEGPENAARTRLIEEIKLSIESYLKEDTAAGRQISGFLVTGADSVTDDFTKFFKASTESSCDMKSPFLGITIADRTLRETGVARDASVCAVCGGPFTAAGINLIPPEQRIRQSQNMAVRKVIRILAFTVIVLLAIFAVIGIKIYRKEKLLKSLEVMYNQVKSTSAGIETKFKRLQAIEAETSGEASSLNVIYNLYSIIPNDISLLDFNYDDAAKTLRFRGRSGRMSDVFKLVTMLEDSESFSNVQTYSIVERRTREGAVVDFQIRCNFNP